jgi:adenylate cyclase
MKFFTSRWMVLAFAILLLFVRVQDSDYVKTLRYKTWDYFQIQSPRANLSDMVAIVDITEQDLKEYGQWPWPRHIMAMLHARISDAGAVMINYNILFAEPDRMGSKQYLNSFPMSDDTRELLQKNLVDTDRVFAIVIKESGNTILMMSVKNERDNILPSTTNIIQKGDATPWIWNYAGIVPPLATLSAGAEGIGVNVTAPEPDSVVRKVPILIRIESKLYPSMVLENIRIINQSRAIKIITKAHGIDEVLVAKNSGIPVNHNAEMYIHYANPDNYIHLSAGDILKGKIDKKDIAGKIIIVGLDAAGLSTLKDTPYGLMTDQTISAQTLDTVLTGDYLFRLPQADTYEILFMGLLGLLMIILSPRASVRLSVPLLIFVLSGISYGSFMAYANKGFLIDPSFAILYIFLIWSHSTYNNFATQSRLRQQIKRQFEHYLAPDMVKKLQKDPSLLKLGGETRTMTFLFSDIRGFTPISEKYKGNPEGLTKLINRFLTRMTDVIIKNGGTIDKSMGDCIMAFWNAPIENGEHEECAVQSAMEMEEELAMLNAELIAEGLPQINIGIGINTGEALVGNMGSKQRFDYSVIGDAVNLASRLESSSKTLGKTIVIGQETVDRAKLNYNFEYIDDIKVKGKTEFIKVYTITN